MTSGVYSSGLRSLNTPHLQQHHSSNFLFIQCLPANRSALQLTVGCPRWTHSGLLPVLTYISPALDSNKLFDPCHAAGPKPCIPASINSSNCPQLAPLRVCIVSYPSFSSSCAAHSPQPVGPALVQIKGMHHKALNFVRVGVQVAVLQLLRTNLQQTAAQQ